MTSSDIHDGAYLVLIASTAVLLFAWWTGHEDIRDVAATISACALVTGLSARIVMGRGA